MDSSPPWMVYANRRMVYANRRISETAQGSSHEDQRPCSMHPTQRDPTAFTHANPLSWKPSEGRIPCQPVCPRGHTSFHLQLIKIHTQKRLWHCYSIYSLAGGVGGGQVRVWQQEKNPNTCVPWIEKELEVLGVKQNHLHLCSLSVEDGPRMARVTWGLTLGSANGQGPELFLLCASHWNVGQHLFGGTQWMDTY